MKARRCAASLLLVAALGSIGCVQRTAEAPQESQRSARDADAGAMQLVKGDSAGQTIAAHRSSAVAGEGPRSAAQEEAPKRAQVHPALDTPPRPRVRVAAAVPDSLLAIADTAMVLVYVQIDTVGRVVDASFLRGARRLYPAAETAVLQWQFDPARELGRPIPIGIIVPVRFGSSLPN